MRLVRLDYVVALVALVLIACWPSRTGPAPPHRDRGGPSLTGILSATGLRSLFR
jgi:hypothetical protein